MKKQKIITHQVDAVVSPFFSLGGITLYYGDARELLPLMGTFDLLITDPPYEMEVLPFTWKEAASAYVFGDKRMIAEKWYSAFGYPNKDLLIWYYKNSPKPKGRWRMSCQGIMYGWNDGLFFEDVARIPYQPATKKLNGRMRPSKGHMTENKPYDTSRGALPRDVIEWPALTGHLSRERVGHDDQKPLGLIEKLIQTVKSESILDPFAGSGTTGIAAYRLGRKCVMIERDRKKCEMIRRRFEG
jgi:DNA modification methylase